MDTGLSFDALSKVFLQVGGGLPLAVGRGKARRKGAASTSLSKMNGPNMVRIGITRRCREIYCAFLHACSMPPPVNP